MTHDEWIEMLWLRLARSVRYHPHLRRIILDAICYEVCREADGKKAS